MKKIKLTESELIKLIENVINESSKESFRNEVKKILVSHDKIKKGEETLYIDPELVKLMKSVISKTEDEKKKKHYKHLVSKLEQ